MATTTSRPSLAARALAENRALEAALAVIVAYQMALLVEDVAEVVRTRPPASADAELDRRARHAERAPNPVLVTALAGGILAAMLLGRWHAVRGARPPRLVDPPAPPDVRADLPRSWQAVATVERAVLDLNDWGLVTRAEYARLRRRARQVAFTIAGVEERSLLDLARRTLRDAMRRRWSAAEAAGELDRAFRGAGFAPLRPWHARLVAQMAYARSYGAAQRAALMNPRIRGIVPAFRWVTRADERVRFGKYNRAHRYVHGLVFARDHRFWRYWSVPAGWNCRCLVVGVSHATWQRLGRTSADWPLYQGRRVMPDPGFARAAPHRRIAAAA